MSERADDDVRGEREQQQRRAARQLKQQQQQQAQFQRGEASTAMATVAERRSLPSLDIMLGQPWHSWADAVKLHGSDGAELEESFKECGKHREAMRLCRDDMPIFGQCPAQDDFYLVMCSHCSQVVKPQAFQAHYERRHSSSNKPQAASAVPIPRNKGSLGGGGGVASGGSLARPSSANSSVSKFFKSAKEKLPFHYRLQQEESPITTGKADKFHVKVDFSAKLTNVPASSSSSSSSNTVSTSPMKPGLNFPSIPKAPPLAPSQMPNGKGHLSSLDKKQDNSSASSRKTLNKRQEREFNPDIHCGVMDLTARKPCTRSLTCKTHSISQRRAVLGRRQRFDTLLAEHKSRARDKELQFRLDTSHPAPPLRDPPPPPSRLTQDPHQASHGNGTADATKPLPLSKPKPHNSALPRLNSINSHSGVDPSTTHQDQAHHPHPAPGGTETSRLSSDEGENEERDEASEKLDCHYSGYHPRPAAYCTFGSRLLGRACFTFDRRWDQVRSALTSMMDKHVNSQMWKKIPLASENSATTPTASHRTSTNSHFSSMSSAFHGLSSPSPYDIKPVLSYGTTLNARSSPQASAAEQPAYSGTSRQVSASSPQMPSAHSSSLPSLGSSRPLKSKSGSKSFRAREPSSSPSNSIIKGSASITSGANSSLSTGKKRKNSSLTSHSAYTSESSSSFTLKKNCALNSSSLGSTYPTSVSSTPSSSSTLSSTSSSHSGVYSVGLNCTPGRANSLSLKQESSGRGPPSGSPAESIKRMSVVMNSSDSTLSLGPFVHQSSDHHTDARLEAKRRKGSPGSSSLNSTGLSLTSSGSGTGSGCVQGPGRPKITKSPSVNNIHSKHTRSISGPPGLPNNSLIYQPKARP